MSESSAIETRVLAVDSTTPDPSAIDQAAKVIKAGGLVAFPTETVYGLGADATDAAAVAKIFTAKQRPTSDPLIVHIAEIVELNAVAVGAPDLAHRLASAFWPGPLTLVLKRADRIPSSVSAGLDTVAVRLPAHKVAVALIRAAQTPIAAPSANLFARPSPTQAKHVLQDLAGKVELILDGGPTDVGLESTVVDLTVHPPAVLRPGGVSIEALRAIVPEIAYTARQVPAGGSVASPGLLLKHYSPRAEVRLFEGARADVLLRMIEEAQRLVAVGQSVGVIAASADVASFDEVQIVDVGSNVDEMGRNLFDALRRLDDLNVDVVLVRMPMREQMGETIRDRLYRAAEGQVIQVD